MAGWTSISLEPLGYCLYCDRGGDDLTLTREHIIPESIDGRTILPKATCEECREKLNREVEQELFGAIYRPARRAFGYRSKNRGVKARQQVVEASTDIEVHYYNGRIVPMKVPYAQAQPDLLGVEFGLPPIVTGDLSGVWHPITLRTLEESAALRRIRRQQGVKGLKYHSTISAPTLLARFLAKVAIGFISIISRETVKKSKLSPIALGCINPFESTEASMCASWLFSFQRAQVLPPRQNQVQVLERFEFGQRHIYCIMNLFPEVFRQVFAVRLLSTEKHNILRPAYFC